MNEQKKIMADIYPATSRPVVRLPKAPQPLPPEPPRKGKKISLVIIGTVFVAAILFYGTRGLVVKRMATDSVGLIRERIAQAKEALLALDITKAEDAFVDIKKIVADIQTEADRYGLLGLAEVIGTVYPKAAAAPESLTIINRLSDKVLSIIKISDQLKSNAFALIQSGQGKTLIKQLSELKSEVSSLGGILEEMKHNAADLDYPVGDDVLAFRAELYQCEQLLGAAIRWLSDTNHLAVLFVNPSEIRPGGGFPGSYAGITIDHGSIGTIEVKDIYDPDGQLDLKVIPPKQLQSITKTWGARDANWFFDFPTSARKTLTFLNSSKIYSEQELEFSAVLAINVRVISDILSVIGPIELPEYKLTLTGDNFLNEVQREVRSGMDRTVGEPKRILKVLTPILIDRLGSMNASQKHALITHIRERFAAKDMMAYIDDTVMQAYLEQLGIAGEVTQNDEANLNEYLAFVNANIGGGKSDAVMSQSITLRSRVDLEGKINNTLTVKRTHNGKGSPDSWYNTTNRDFFQIYTPRGSKITTVRGIDTPPTVAKSDFKGYEKDGDLTSIEGSNEYLSSLGVYQTLAFNKTVFSGWLNTEPGTSRTIEVQYVNPQKMNPRGLADYSFVFEKQSGVDTELSVSIEAPPEYKWKENNSAVYTYGAKSAPGQVRIRLTLIPIR